MHVTLVNKAKTNATLIFPVFFPLLIQNVNAEKDKLLNYNSAELEDCDVFPEASFSITHFDESLRPSQVVSSPRGTVLLLYALTWVDGMCGTFTVTCFNQPECYVVFVGNVTMVLMGCLFQQSCLN